MQQLRPIAARPSSRSWLVALATLQVLTLGALFTRGPADAAAASRPAADDADDRVLLLPNPAAQRAQIIEELRRLNDQLESLRVEQSRRPL